MGLVVYYAGNRVPFGSFTVGGRGRGIKSMFLFSISKPLFVSFHDSMVQSKFGFSPSMHHTWDPIPYVVVGARPRPVGVGARTRPVGVGAT